MNSVGIKVIGIGTVGNDVLNRMMKKEITEVEFVGIDTNQENLDKLNVGSKGFWRFKRKSAGYIEKYWFSIYFDGNVGKEE